jgi:hypothetical protein
VHSDFQVEPKHKQPCINKKTEQGLQKKPKSIRLTRLQTQTETKPPKQEKNAYNEVPVNHVQC